MSETVLETAAAAGSSAPAGTGLGIEIVLIPDEVELALLQARESGSFAQSPWHHVTPGIGALVSLRSQAERLRIVRLSVTSQTYGWSPLWPHWSYALRRTPKDFGGDALSAQDELAEDESTLTLLMLPGEQRQATLEFRAVLDGFAYPGDFAFDVLLTDTETGDSATYPGILRLRHPKSALLDQLPAIYTQTPARPVSRYAPYEDAPFFERYLRGFEDAAAPTLELLVNLATYFDADETAADLLPWLSSWVSLLLDEKWSQLKRRRLVKEVVELYRWRGTRRGLARYLELYTGITPEINDQPFVGMRLGPETRLGRDTILGDVPPHTFVVTLAVPDLRMVEEQTVREIIESNKPAHTGYELRIVERGPGE